LKGKATPSGKFMNDIPKIESPSPQGFFHWLFSWRTVRRALIGLFALTTLTALFVTEENWRGKHEWDAYRHQQETKGERFNWQAFAPPPVPDDQNFLAAPVFTNMLSDKSALNPFPKSDQVYTYTNGDWQKNSLTDLQSWQNAYRHLGEDGNGKTFPVSSQPETPAKDVLFALGKFDPQLEELRQASLRPYAYVPIHYEDGIYVAATTQYPYFAVIKRCAQILQLRSVAELADGQNSNALEDVKLLLRLNGSLRSSPLLISQLVHMAIVSIWLQPVWEGLAEHRWTDEQLVTLDTELAKEDFLADYEFAMRGERTCAISTFEDMRRTGEIATQGEDGNTMTVKVAWMPNAYFYQNELAFARLYQERLFPLVDTNSRTISPEVWCQVDAAVQADRKHFFPPYTIMARMTVPALDAAVKKFAIAQSSVDLARVACALERYHLAHGQYPDSLDDLAPQFIAQVPHDIINGQPLHYHLKSDGTFFLYSVGWNETDDGGTVVLNKSGKIDHDQGDWVWQYPQKN
jgi:hypothetical protein